MPLHAKADRKEKGMLERLQSDKTVCHLEPPPLSYKYSPRITTVCHPPLCIQRMQHHSVQVPTRSQTITDVECVLRAGAKAVCADGWHALQARRPALVSALRPALSGVPCRPCAEVGKLYKVLCSSKNWWK